MLRLHVIGAALCAVVACKSSTTYDEVPGTQIVFEPGADLHSQAQFYDLPWPSDLRLADGGYPDMTGFPNAASNTVVQGLLATVPDRQGFPLIAAAYFRLTAAPPAMSADNVIPATTTSPVLIVDTDPSSPDRGTLFPAVAASLSEDDYTPSNLIAVVPPPGVILMPHRQYAYVVMRSLTDASGAALGIPLSFQQMKQAASPGGASAAAWSLYQPLWATLKEIGVSIDDVAGATLFTTGDVVQDLATMTTQLMAKYPLQIDPSTFVLNTSPGDFDDNPRFCELQGTLDMPMFQQGTPPYNTEGGFVLGPDGLPTQQGMQTIPIVVTIPKTPMPAAGYPLMVYEHGSGGLSTSIADRGKTLTPNGNPTPGRGPAYIIGQYGIAGASSALPLNPERLPGATDYEYLNPENLPVFPFNFQEGVIEQRLYFQALKSLQIPASAVSGCTGPSLPGGVASYSFDPSHFVFMGQSMGAMYANMIAAVEPRIQAVVPTGSGGYWSYMILTTGIVPGQVLLQGLLEVNTTLSYLHPVLQLLQTAWEPADPMVFTPRLAARPLPGAPARPIYEPVGTDDSYFSEGVLDAMALAYGNQEAGQVLWQSLQTTLTMGNLQGLLPYPVQQNRTSASGGPYTGVVAEYANDGILDGHYIAFQLDSVKYQYGCFLDTFISTGVATALAPPAGYDADNPAACTSGM